MNSSSFRTNSKSSPLIDMAITLELSFVNTLITTATSGRDKVSARRAFVGAEKWQFSPIILNILCHVVLRLLKL